MLLGMISLGGATRLTGSGLSIMEWNPIQGIIPPLSHAEWERLFALYKTIPQYKILHNGFSLHDFQTIFWLEWIHRFWGRLMGFALVLPLIYFIYKKMVTVRLALILGGLFVLGGLQGLIGWFMVASGFNPNSTAVAPVRLVLHLLFALLLYAALLWTAFSTYWPKQPLQQSYKTRSSLLLAGAWFCLLLLTLTIIAGGLTAGTHAGFIFNEFPLMGGSLIPADYAHLHPFWRNGLENTAAVQFNHRLLATFCSLAILTLIFCGLKKRLERHTQISFILLGWAIILQYSLGITTLLLVVPVWAGTLHQTWAAIVLGLLLFVIYQLHLKPLQISTLAEQKSE
ncbi:COX15/CtaA family protein [Entomobacter blattae]